MQPRSLLASPLCHDLNSCRPYDTCRSHTTNADAATSSGLKTLIEQPVQPYTFLVKGTQGHRTHSQGNKRRLTSRSEGNNLGVVPFESALLQCFRLQALTHEDHMDLGSRLFADKAIHVCLWHLTPLHYLHDACNSNKNIESNKNKDSSKSNDSVKNYDYAFQLMMSCVRAGQV